MGCGAVAVPQDKHGSQKQGNELFQNRKNQKKGALNARVNQDTVFENVSPSGSPLSEIDKYMIDKILAKHYLLYKLSREERKQLIEKIEIYSTAKNECVFEQGSPASMFFIIQKGMVKIEINGKPVKNMGPKQYFGELALIYAATRSATVTTVEDCSFWCLKQTDFKKTLSELVKRNYKIAKNYIRKVPMFNFLSEKELDSLAYNMYTLKYENNDVVFKEGDDSNSFYLIAAGEIQVEIPGKSNLVLREGESFGQNSLKKSEIRSGTAKSLGKSHVLSIGREDVILCLGENFTKLLYYNTVKWSFKRSKAFSEVSLSDIENFIAASKLKKYKDGDLVLDKKQEAKYLYISVEGGINDYEEGKLIFDDSYHKTTEKLTKSLYKKQQGYVFRIEKQRILAILGKSEPQIKDELRSSVMVKAVKQKQSTVKLEDLMMLKKLGEGQFGKVYLVKDTKKDQRYALKCVEKNMIVKNKMENFIRVQKEILEELDFPLIVGLERSFKDKQFIYLLMNFIEGGDFFDILREIGLLNSRQSKFYMACLILAVEQMHKNNIVYRDLKPENAVVDANGYLHVIDLGTAKKLQKDLGYRTFTTIGTPHYMGPEILQGKGYSFSVDIWSLGVILYEMVCGRLPYGDNLDDPMDIYNEIQKTDLQFPDFYKDKEGKEMIKRLLIKHPESRSVDNFKVLKKGDYMKEINWKGVLSKSQKAPYIPLKKEMKEKQFENVRAIEFLDKECAKIKKSAKSAVPNWDDIF